MLSIFVCPPIIRNIERASSERNIESLLQLNNIYYFPPVCMWGGGCTAAVSRKISTASVGRNDEGGSWTLSWQSANSLRSHTHMSTFSKNLWELEQPRNLKNWSVINIRKILRKFRVYRDHRSAPPPNLKQIFFTKIKEQFEKYKNGRNISVATLMLFFFFNSNFLFN